MKKGGMPLARLRLRLPTREGEVIGEKTKSQPQFPLAEPAYILT